MGLADKAAHRLRKDLIYGNSGKDGEASLLHGEDVAFSEKMDTPFFENCIAVESNLHASMGSMHALNAKACITSSIVRSSENQGCTHEDSPTNSIKNAMPTAMWNGNAFNAKATSSSFPPSTENKATNPPSFMEIVQQHVELEDVQTANVKGISAIYEKLNAPPPLINDVTQINEGKYTSAMEDKDATGVGVFQ